MSNNSAMSALLDNTTRPFQLLRNAQIPKDLWKRLDHFRHEYKILNPMPQWSFAPRQVYVAALRNGWSEEEVTPRIRSLLPFFQVMGSWRIGQGIYRFDTSVFASLIDMDLPNTIPVETMKFLPEWAIWVETPGITLEGSPVKGFFATIEQDTDSETPLMMLLVDSERKLEISKFSLLPGVSIQECITESALMGYFFSTLDDCPIDEIGNRQFSLLKPFLNLLLFITTQASEITSEQDLPPRNQEPKLVKGKERFFPPKKPIVWDVGLRIGAALKSNLLTSGESNNGQNTVRPHMRRAHWHGYWIGPRNGLRTFDLRWLPPIAVNIHEECQLPVVIHPVHDK